MKIITKGIAILVLGILGWYILEVVPITLPPYSHTDIVPQLKSERLPPSPLLFVDETLERGIIKQHTQRGKKINNISESLGAGACAFDYDNDNWIDLLVLGGNGQQHYSGHREWWQSQGGLILYRNKGDGYFEDVTEQSNLISYAWHMGCMASDLNNDGFKDLLITNNGENQLLANNGDGTFSEIEKFDNTAQEKWSTSAVPIDFNQDGLLDIYIANYIDFSVQHRTLESSAGFDTHIKAVFDPRAFNAQSNQLLKNLGGFKFESSNEASAISDGSGRSLSVNSTDYDGDNLPDLFVLNDSQSPNRLFRNNGDSQFIDVSTGSDFSATTSSRDISISYNETTHQHQFLISTENLSPPIIYTLSDSNNKNSFEDALAQSGLGSPQYFGSSGYGLTIADFNTDGFMDIFQANGHLAPSIHAPSFPEGQLNQIWLGHLDGYEPCQNCLPTYPIQSSRALVTADFDNDGDLDVYISNNNDLGQLLINQTNPKQWIGVQFETVDVSAPKQPFEIHNADTRIPVEKLLNRNHRFLSTSDERLIFYPTDSETESSVLTTKDSFSLTLSAEKNSISTVLNSGKYYRISRGGETTILKSKKNLQTQNNEISNLDRVTAALSPEQLLIVLKWLIELGNVEYQKQLATHLLQLNKENVLIELAKLLGESKHVSALPSLLQLNKAPSDDVVAESIRALGQLELESTYSLFQQHLFSPSSKVRCAATETITKFFIEEEAMIRSKTIFIPTLLKGLQKYSDNETQKCFIHALGESESYISSQWLQKHALPNFSQFDSEIQTEIIIALGKNRQQSALPWLNSIFSNTAHPPNLRALALTSSRQLGESWDSIGQLITKASEETTDQITTASLLSTLKTLLVNAQHQAIIPTKFTVSKLSEWWQSSRSLPQWNQTNLIELTEINFLNQQKLGHNNIFTTKDIIYFRGFLKSNNSKIRTTGYQTLFALGNKVERITLIQQALSDEDKEINLLAIGFAEQVNIELLFDLGAPNNNLTRLLSHLYEGRKNPSDNNLSKMKLAVEQLLSTTNFPIDKISPYFQQLPILIFDFEQCKNWVLSLAGYSTSQSSVKAFFTLCEPRALTWEIFSKSIDQLPFNYDSNSQSETIKHLISSRFPQAILKLSGYIENRALSLEVREKIINDPIIKNSNGLFSTIKKVSKNINDPLSYTAKKIYLDILGKRNPSLAKEMYLDKTRTMDHRFSALEVLYQRNPSSLTELLGQF